LECADMRICTRKYFQSGRGDEIMRALTMLANFALVMATVYFAIPVALPGVDITIAQSAAITLLAFVWRTLLSPEPPEVYLVNGQLTEEDAE
jgi:hypothetical protein